MTQQELLFQTFHQAGIDLTDRQVEQLMLYDRELVRVNEVMNLTAVTEFEDVLTKHFLDSASLLFCLGRDRLADRTVIDVGSGAGFPGVVLKILEPSLQLTILDSLQKRLSFLTDLTAQLGISGVRMIHARAEDGGRDPQLRETFDLAVARAVAQLPVLCEYCLPFVRIGGEFIAYKAGNVEEECAGSMRASRMLGGSRPSATPFVLPGTDLGRSLVVIRKNKETPPLYPRKAGLPSRRPL